MSSVPTTTHKPHIAISNPVAQLPGRSSGTALRTALARSERISVDTAARGQRGRSGSRSSWRKASSPRQSRYATQRAAGPDVRPANTRTAVPRAFPATTDERAAPRRTPAHARVTSKSRLSRTHRWPISSSDVTTDPGPPEEAQPPSQPVQRTPSDWRPPRATARARRTTGHADPLGLQGGWDRSDPPATHVLGLVPPTNPAPHSPPRQAPAPGRQPVPKGGPSDGPHTGSSPRKPTRRRGHRVTDRRSAIPDRGNRLGQGPRPTSADRSHSRRELARRAERQIQYSVIGYIT